MTIAMKSHKGKRRKLVKEKEEKRQASSDYRSMTGSMKITENRWSRLRHYTIGAPKRFLRRARDLYVDSMVSFDGKVASANVVACPVTHISNLPKNFGRQNSTKLDDKKNLEELYRSISRKYNWSSTEFDKTGPNGRGWKINGPGAMDRSYSVALGKIGRIDEEQPCDFQDDGTMTSDILFTRSRSHAVETKNVFYC
ncbi:hypothetical protein Sango_2514100 [Sesamum angolense]|uniref:Uncharacterized protein n=1 Tax=Sesamum angolense TaxID=2727404 RepID=A0AAE2BIB8_9LAMI|nr:hypothetical protein Sango_2514100 [Sesamum angolense]